MTMPSMFLGCFVIGFVLSALSFAFGIVDAHVHFPWETHVHLGGVHAPHTYAVGPVNFATLCAFLAWFGGAGYLLTTEFHWVAVPTLIASVFTGALGAGIVFWLMAHVLWSPHENMQSVDYHMVGTLGTVTQPIRPDGIGELVYLQGGTRKSCGARSADNQPIDRGSEVVVTGYERGIASVKRWSDLAER
jgi:membrane protein implicated in regulation of membrane protease activity